MQAGQTRRLLSQDEIDATFRQMGPAKSAATARADAPRYDFLRPDRIPVTQLRAIHLLHENLARLLASSLSAYLRTFVAVNLISFEQLSYVEFVDGLPAQTLMVGVSLRPFDGSGVIEISPSLFFPVLETLLGGGGRNTQPIAREITDIEQRLIEGFIRVVLHDLKEAWKAVVPVEFAVQAIEKEPQFLQLLAPTEAVVAVGVEICVGGCTGAMNIAIPSLVIKMVRQKFNQQWVTRRTESSEEDQHRMLRLVEPADTEIEVSIGSSTCSLRELTQLQTGDVLVLDTPSEEPLRCLVNGERRFDGHLAQTGRRCVYVIDGLSGENA